MDNDDEEPAVASSSKSKSQQPPPPPISAPPTSDDADVNTPQCLREKVAFYETVWKRSKVIYPHLRDDNDTSDSSSLEYVQKLSDRDSLHLPLRPDYSTQSTSCSSSLASTTPTTPLSQSQLKQTTIKIHCKRTNDQGTSSFASPAIETKTIKIVRRTPVTTPRNVGVGSGTQTIHDVSSPIRDHEWYHDYQTLNFQNTGTRLDYHARSKVEFDIHIKEIRGKRINILSVCVCVCNIVVTVYCINK